MKNTQKALKLGKKTAFKVLTALLVLVMAFGVYTPAFSVLAAEALVSTVKTSEYDFENYEYNHTPTFPCVGDSTVIVYPDPVNASNKALLVDSAGSAAKATYYFTDVTEVFEVSVDVYVPSLTNWQIGIFPDQIDGSIQFAVTGDASGNLAAAKGNVSTYRAGEWFNVKIVADPVNEVADVYINGTAVATGVAYYGSGVGYGYSGGVYLSSKVSNGELYFDNLVTPIHDEVHVEKYIPEYIKTQILSSATPDQCGHDPDNQLLYSAFPSVKKINDEKAIIIFHRGVKHAYSHGVLDCIVFNPKTEEVISQSVIYDDPEHNAQNADLIICPNGDLLITLNEQYPNDSADPYESLIFRSTDEGETWVKSQQPTDQFGHHYSVVHDYAIVGNDLYLLAHKDPDLNNDETLDYMCLVKSSDNGVTWTFVKNLYAEMQYEFNESTIETYDNDKLVFVGRGNKKVTKAAILDLEGNALKIRNIGVDFDCVDHNGKAEIILKDGKYYLIMRSILNDTGNAMELPLLRINPETLALETYVELQPKNTGTNGGDGFYAEAYFQEKDGEEYFNVVTYTRNPTNTGTGGVPSIVRFEYKWDEIKDPVFTENTVITEVEEIKTDITQLNRTETVTLTFDRDAYNYQQLGGTTTRSAIGVAAVTADGNADRLFNIAEGRNGAGAIKWAANSSTQSGEVAILLGKQNIAATGIGAAYALAPNRTYTVSYVVKGGGANVGYGLKALSTHESTVGYTLSTHTEAAADFTVVTDTFTTPDAATLGENVYLSLYVTNSSVGTAVSFIIDDVTINAQITATQDEVITFNDNGKIYYANADVLTVLPDGNNGSFDSKFIAWVDQTGTKITEIPANGTVLTAQYPLTEELSATKTEAVTLTFDKLLTYKNISGNANGTSGIIAATPSSTVYSREFGGNYGIKVNGTKAKNVVGLYLAKDDNAYAGDQYGYILSPNAKYEVSFDACITPITEGTTVTIKVKGVRSSSAAVIASGIDFGTAATITEAGVKYSNYNLEFTTPEIASLGKNAKLELVLECSGSAETYSYSAYIDNVVIKKTVDTSAALIGDTFVEYNGEQYFYKNGVLNRSNTLAKINGIWHHVNGGKFVKDTTLVKYNGVYYYVKNGVKSTDNTLCLYNGVYYHVKGGKYVKDTTLVKYNSKWYYVENGVYVKKTALVKYGNTYYYVKNGVKTTTANTLIKIDGVWHHVKDGKWAKDTTLVKYTDGVYYYVKDGVKDATANTLCKYNGAYYHVKGGKYVKDTTLVKYNSKWYYVKNGKFDKTFNGKVLYGGKYYTVKNGVKV